MKEQLCPTCVKRGDGKCAFEEALGQLVEEIRPAREKKITKKARLGVGKSLILYLGEALERNCPETEKLKTILEKSQGQKPEARAK